MREMAFLAIGVLAGVLIGCALALQFLDDRLVAADSRAAIALKEERAARCGAGSSLRSGTASRGGRREDGVHAPPLPRLHVDRGARGRLLHRLEQAHTEGLVSVTVGGISIDYEPGQSYTHTDGTEQSRASARQEAVKRFQDAAAATTRGHLEQAVGQVLALVIQLRGVNGSAAGTGLGAKLREAADFLEDL